MWIDTNVNGERRLLNMEKQKQLYIEMVSKYSTAYQIKLGTGYFADVLGVFKDYPAALAEFENICAALNDGLYYYKIQEAVEEEQNAESTGGD